MNLRKNVFTLFLFFFIITTTTFGQTFKAYVKAGDKAMEQNDYFAAMVYFKNALEIKENSAEVMYKYAEVARAFHGYEIAETYYEKVLKSDKGEEFPLTNFWLGNVKKSQGDYASAIRNFEKYISNGNGNTEMVAKAKMEIEASRWAIDVIAVPEEIEVNRLNKRVNSPFSDFGAYMKGDTLFYSSYKFKPKKDDHTSSRKISKVLYSIKGSKGRPIKNRFNSDNNHTAHTSFSRDKKRLYYTDCKFQGKIKITCTLCYKEKDKKKRWKKKAVKLPESINKKGFTATHPTIGFDKNTGKEVLYFVSNRPGGKGKLDIWMTKVNGNKFSDPINLESINTTEDDLTPFFHEPSQTLYFSSDGYIGLGGYDIYKSKKSANNWTKPEHTGYPLNSSYNDLYYSISPDSSSVFIASNRPGSFYLNKKNKTCCNDIYKVTPIKEVMPDEEPPLVDSLLIVIEEEEEEITPPIVDIDIVTSQPPQVPTKLEDFLPLALYYDNDEPDKRTRNTTTKKSYEDSYLTYSARKYEFIKEYSKPLKEEDKYNAEIQITAFFDNKVKKGYDHLFLFSEILLRRLNDGDKVEIFLKGFTSPRAKTDYNLYLSKRRISCVRNHFTTYAGGIFKSYLNSGQLIISEKPFGETTASTNISDDLNDQRNSIYSVGASIERRVEIVEIKRSRN